MADLKEADSATRLSQGVSSGSPDLQDFPYLQKLERLQDTYPALRNALDKLRNSGDRGRQMVAQRYAKHGRTPGRCAVLTFNPEHVQAEPIFDTSDKLETYLKKHPTDDGDSGRRRLFILEDLEPSFVDCLGEYLDVDPLVFSSQTNTWNFTDSKSIPYRGLPSLQTPAKSFTLRYWELRTLDDEDTITTKKVQMTYAANRRMIERWRDVDTKSVPADKRHAFVRRCASFWCSADFPDENDHKRGWDAVILVDPPMNSCSTCAQHNAATHKPNKPELEVERDGKPDEKTCKPSCLTIEDQATYEERKDLWFASSWNDQRIKLREARHNSVPYHGGCPSVVPSTLRCKDSQEHVPNTASLLDELVFHWKTCTDKGLLKRANTTPVNTAYHLLKFVAQHWNHQLDLITYGVSISEWFADDHDATMDSRASLQDWRTEIKDISKATKDINYTRRQMSHFERAISLNIERLGVQLGCEAIDNKLPKALADAQKDFLAISYRLRPLRERVDDLSNIASNVTSLRAAFKGLQDGEQGLKLSIFASIIFPLTLVAAMFSMSDGYRPGQTNFWVFWAASVPLAAVIGVGLLYNHAIRTGRTKKGEIKRWMKERREERQWRRESARQRARGPAP